MFPCACLRSASVYRVRQGVCLFHNSYLEVVLSPSTVGFLGVRTTFQQMLWRIAQLHDSNMHVGKARIIQLATGVFLWRIRYSIGLTLYQVGCKLGEM